MKQSLIIILLFLSISLFGQKDFGDFLDNIDRGATWALTDLATEVIKPEYQESLKSNADLIPIYIEEAQMWSKLSAEDIKAWTLSISYLLELGYELNEFKKDKGEPLFYLTSSMWTDFSAENGDNQYKLNTSLFELGGKSDTDVDGGSYLHWILRDESSESPWLNAYLNDFKRWPVDRKRKWLFTTFSEEDTEDYSSALERMIKDGFFDVNLRSKNGKKNLFDAALENGNVFGASLLVENGFDVNKRCFDCEGESSMHHVVSAEYWEGTYDLIVKMIDSAGADLNLRDMSGLTPIHWAIKEKNEQAFTAFMREESEFIEIMPVGKKEINYLEYFKEQWTDDPEDDFMLILINRTELEHPPTKEEAKVAEEEAKAAEEEAKAAEKEAKKAGKKGKKKKGLN